MSATLAVGGTSRGTLPSLTFAQVNALNAGSWTSRLIRATDVGVNGTILVSDGSKFNPSGGAILLLNPVPVTGIVNSSETIQAQSGLIPKKLIRAGAKIRFFVSLYKSGTADTFAFRLRLGTAGTTSDASVLLNASLTTTSKAMVWERVIARTSATTVMPNYDPTTTTSFAASGTTDTADVTVSDMDSNDLYLSFSLWRSAGTTESVAIKSLIATLHI